MTRTGSRADATATAIEDATLDLAIEGGYDGLTVDRICEVVGISQRTFFNHFPTKDDAVLGRELPRIDERAARRFILSDGPLLMDALLLIPILEGDGAPPRMQERMRVITRHPHLLSRQIHRVAALEAELREIVALRIAHADPQGDEDERDLEAAMVTNILAGIIRFATSGEMDAFTGEGMQARVDRTRVILGRVLER